MSDELGLEKVSGGSSHPRFTDFRTDFCIDDCSWGGISEVEWLRALSVSGVAFVLSILTSLATGLPEVPELEKKPPSDEKEEQE